LPTKIAWTKEKEFHWIIPIIASLRDIGRVFISGFLTAAKLRIIETAYIIDTAFPRRTRPSVGIAVVLHTASH